VGYGRAQDGDSPVDCGLEWQNFRTRRLVVCGCFPRVREREVERGDAEGRGELDFNKYGFQLKAAARRRARGCGQAVAVVLK
jgi:hypothetical protein